MKKQNLKKRKQIKSHISIQKTYFSLEMILVVESIFKIQYPINETILTVCCIVYIGESFQDNADVQKLIFILRSFDINFAACQGKPETVSQFFSKAVEEFTSEY